MLVLTRSAKPGEESVIIGNDDVEVKILSVCRGAVRIGFDAPRNISIHRKEVYLKINKQKGGNRNENNI